LEKIDVGKYTIIRGLWLSLAMASIFTLPSSPFPLLLVYSCDMNKITSVICGVAVATMISSCASAPLLKERIVCEGEYDGHLQGVATDGEAIYWSFTKTLVKTDLSGRALAKALVPSHHGDLCVKDGIVYVAVNLGKFNTETAAVSRVTSYSAKDLSRLHTWALDAMPHGAGGMTWAKDRFFVVGGLPPTHEQNYVYEYTPDFNLVKRHEIATGFTLMGIQTAAFEGGRFLFGIYGGPGNPHGIVECQQNLKTFRRFTGKGDVGILTLGGVLYAGGTKRTANKLHVGWLEAEPNLVSAKNEYRPASGKGTVCLTFDDRNFADWEAMLPVFAKHGAHASFFISGEINAPAIATMRKLRAAGHTVGLHGRKHKPLSHYANLDEWFAAEIAPQLDACKAAGFKVESFAYPFNGHTAESDAFLAGKGFRHFRAGCGYTRGKDAYRPLSQRSDAFVKPADLAKTRVMNAVGIGKAFNSSAPDLVRAIRRTAETGETISFFSHAIRPEGGNYDVTPQTVEALVSEAKRLGVRAMGLDELP